MGNLFSQPDPLAVSTQGVTLHLAHWWFRLRELEADLVLEGIAIPLGTKIPNPNDRTKEKTNPYVVGGEWQSPAAIQKFETTLVRSWIEHPQVFTCNQEIDVKTNPVCFKAPEPTKTFWSGGELGITSFVVVNLRPSGSGSEERVLLGQFHPELCMNLDTHLLKSHFGSLGVFPTTSSLTRVLDECLDIPPVTSPGKKVCNLELSGKLS